MANTSRVVAPSARCPATVVLPAVLGLGRRRRRSHGDSHGDLGGVLMPNPGSLGWKLAIFMWVFGSIWILRLIFLIVEFGVCLLFWLDFYIFFGYGWVWFRFGLLWETYDSVKEKSLQESSRICFLFVNNKAIYLMLGLLGHSNQLIDEARKRLASKQRQRKSVLKKNGALQTGLHYNIL